MKSLFWTIFLLMLFFSLPAQDLKNLDKQFGFQKFKLESKFQQHKNNLEFMFEGYDRVKYYKYIKSDIKTVFGIDIYEINLGFFENKLYTISIDFFMTDDFVDKHLQKNLADLFGEQRLLGQSTSSDEQSKYEWGMNWKTEKISMQLSKYSCSSKISPCQTELFMFSRKIRKLIDNNLF